MGGNRFEIRGAEKFQNIPADLVNFASQIGGKQAVGPGQVAGEGFGRRRIHPERHREHQIAARNQHTVDLPKRFLQRWHSVKILSGQDDVVTFIGFGNPVKRSPSLNLPPEARASVQ